MAIAISLISTIFILVVFFGLKDFVDISIKREFSRLQSHFTVIFSDFLNPTWIPNVSDISILILALGNAVIVYCLVPVMIRFGNCWTEMKEPETKEDTIL